MRTIPYFDNVNLLLFECIVEYKNKHRAWLALDTGASTTIVSNEIIEKIGFQPNEIKDYVEFGDASQDHTVPRMILPSFRIGDTSVTNLEVLAYSLPEKYGIDGVIGLNFLRRFRRFTIDFERACLVLE